MSGILPLLGRPARLVLAVLGYLALILGIAAYQIAMLRIREAIPVEWLLGNGPWWRWW
jgi:hypothetical protein